MPHLDLEGDVKLNDTDACARAALSVFRRLQPTLTMYAQTLTGRRDVRVVPAAQDNGSTDGKTIFYRPPMALGDPTPHVRQLCDKRNGYGLMRCAACAIREKVLVTIYHEIGHIWFDSFESTTEADKRNAIKWITNEKALGSEWARQASDRIKAAPPSTTGSYIGLAGLINEYLPLLVNAMEDARINRRLFLTKIGLRHMFQASTAAIFREGFEVRDHHGNVTSVNWKKRPLNTQAIIGILCIGCGYNYDDWLHPKVVHDLHDKKLNAIVSKMNDQTTASEVYRLSFEVLQRLRELGYCGTPQDPETPEEEPDEQDSSNGETGEEESSDREDLDGVPDPNNDGQPSHRGADAGAEADEVPEDDASEASSDSGDAREAGQGDEPDDGDSGHSEEVSDSEGASSSSDGPGDFEEDASASSDGSGDDDGDGVASSDSVSEDGTSGDGVNSPEHDSGVREVSDDSSESSPSSGNVGDSQDDTGWLGEDDGDDERSPVDRKSSEGDNGTDHNPEVCSTEDDGSEGESDPLVRDGDESVSEDGASLDSGAPSMDLSGVRDSDTGGKNDSLEARPADADALPDDDGSERDGDASGDDLIDTGADDGYGGTSIERGQDWDDEDLPEMGTPSDAEPALLKWNQHEEKPKTVSMDREQDSVDKAIVQGIYFTTPSDNIVGVNEHEHGISNGESWHRGRKEDGVDNIAEAILSPALARMRRAFTDNKRNALVQNKKSGRVNKRVLGKRAWNDDPRLFAKKILPGKKDYEVIIGVDISYSTVGRNLFLEKRAVLAQARLLHRAGIPFSVYAHTGEPVDGLSWRDMTLDIYKVKTVKQPWDADAERRLLTLGPVSANLDGHAMEYLRKRADESRATDKIILYYSDGKMPAENHDEELEILQREIRYCRTHNYTLLGVGIRTDSPRAHGLDTVEVNDDQDLIAVVKHLEKRLSERV